jgi:hypothetical protein
MGSPLARYGGHRREVEYKIIKTLGYYTCIILSNTVACNQNHSNPNEDSNKKTADTGMAQNPISAARGMTSVAGKGAKPLLLRRHSQSKTL